MADLSPRQPGGGAHRRTSRLRARDWRVRTKLAAVLTLPLAAFLGLAGLQITGSVTTATDLGTFSRQVAVGRYVSVLVHELQRERDRTAGVLAALAVPSVPAPSRDVAGLAEERIAVDTAAARLRTEIQPLLRNEATARAYGQAEAQLEALANIRSGAELGWLRTEATFDMYTRTIASLQSLLPSPVDVGGDAGLARVVRGFTNLALAKELTAQIRGQLFIICSGTRFEAGEFDSIADVRAKREAAIERFRSDADPAQLAEFDDIVTGQAVRNAGRLEQTIIANSAGTEIGVEPQQWWAASTTELELMRTVELTLLDQAVRGVTDASSRQWRTTILGSLASICLMTLAVMLSVFIGRSMAFSLRSLREQAMLVAHYRLPHVIEQLRISPTKAPPLRVDPVLVHSRDEVGEVAQAFTAVHRSAVRLAAEQAVMRRNVNEIFIKLARRSQTLVERQLRLLDTMESAEVDPDQLENLFRLDHLATRLRRNDENLLVLAGGDTTRTWNRTVDVNMIALAATAEIEQYARVRQEITTSAHVVGYAVSDLVNLVAELLENATSFSAPETTVVVLGHDVPDGSVEIVISDSGMGMSDEAIAEANRQVTQPVSIDISAAERMGLVVVGHLARRQGISVELSSTEQGVTVRVGIPARLVTQPAPDEEEPAVQPARWLNPEPKAIAATPAEPPAPVFQRRFLPTRAEDVLSPRRSGSNIWWSREAATQPRPAPAPPQPAAPPALTESGLPVRVRMAQLPVPAVSEPVSAPPDVDPEETGDMLARLYSGMRQADAETADHGIPASEPST